jgi:ABC-type branched-subunit amino acid transport system substrate-binding protein
MRRLSCSVSGIFFIFLCAPSFLRLRFVTESANVTTLKIGLYANAFLSNGSSDDNGAQSLAGFLMAIREINSIPSILPNIRLAVALRSGRGVYGAITAAQAFTTANFSIDSQGKRVPDSTFIRNNPVGVDVILGAGNDVETEQTNQVLNYFKIVQLHTVATSTDLGVGQDYPYKIQTTPIISYEAMVLQHMLCFYFNIEKIAIIATDDNNGLKSVVEIGDGNYCSLKSISVQSFALGVSDFTNIISTAKLSGARIFVLFMPSSSAAMFLEQAYDQGLLTEGTQVFGNSLTMEDPISSHFKNPSNAKNIMRGFIGIKYSPNFAVHATPVGRGFAHRFGQQVDTVGTASDGSTTCSNSTDDTNESLYQPQTAHGLSQSACSGLRFSRFRSNGSVSNSANGIYQFTPHAYDAVYALAQGIQRILAVHGRDDINGDLLHSTFINDIYFYGATGLVKFYGGMSNYLYYAMGDREVGHTYLMYNFNDEVYDASNRTNGLALVASWSLETGGVTLCSEDPELVMGGNCVSGFTYRTVDNSPCTDMPPDIYVELSVHMGRAMTALGSVVVIVVATFFILIFKYRRSRLIKASQPSMIYIIHLGCLFGGMRTIVGGMSVDDASCTAAFWTGHLAFGLTFSALLVKTWRVHRVVNNKSLKRVKITGNTITGITCTVISCLCFYLIITTVVGKPHLSYLSSEVSNQITRNAICSFTYPEFSTALYAIEALSLMYGARLCYATKNAPDAINEAYFIASGKLQLMSSLCISYWMIRLDAG